MAYVPNFDWDIFISYAHVDNDTDMNGKRWVEQFHKFLKKQLARQFGRIDYVSIWWDDRLGPTDIIKASIIDACKRSALLICITSPGYVESGWCKDEYKIFCEANQNSFPPIHENKSRIINVRVLEPSQASQRMKYDEMFGHSLGYIFFNLHNYTLPPTISAYRIKIEELAREIHDLLVSMRNKTQEEPQPTFRYALLVDPSVSLFSRVQAEEFIAKIREIYNEPHLTLIMIVKGLNSTKLIVEGPRAVLTWFTEPPVNTRTVLDQKGIKVTGVYPVSLDEILFQSKKRLIISGHTLNRFSDDDKIRNTVESLLRKGVQVTFIALNPKSKHAEAHTPYHELESSGTSKDQYKKVLDFMSELFEKLDPESRTRLEVLLSNYMPRFRAITVDEKHVYFYLYMYGDDVNDYPDFILEKDVQTSSGDEGVMDSGFKRITSSISNLIFAPEIIPYIRHGRLNKHWEHSHLAQWDTWTQEIRYRHRITHQFYFNNAIEFNKKFGNPVSDIEIYVKKHLNLLSGRTLVLGCGSGKEVKHLSNQDRCSQLYGVDFSPEALKLARDQYPNLADQFIVADFYDLEYIVDGEFDSIAANAAFVHLFERKDISTILQRIFRKLKPGGLCFIRNLYREVDGKPIDQEYFKSKQRFDYERWFVYYSRPYLAELAKNAGFFIDEEATQKIANDCSYDLNIVMEKGFPHDRFIDVWWPTILLVKPDGK